MKLEPQTCIVSNNCWGSVYYQERLIEYNTPFVGLYVNADDYLALLKRFRHYMDFQIDVSFESRHGTASFPIGKIGDSIEINFLHYDTCEEAHEKWTRRTLRMPKDDENLLVKICDRDGFEERHIEQFESIDFPNKIGFLKRGRFKKFNKNIFHEIDCEDECCPSGIDLYHITKNLISI